MRASSMPRAGGRARPRFAAGVTVVLGIQLLALLVGAAALGTWQDEEYTLATTAHGVAYAFHRALDYELQAPLYFVIVAALRSASDAVFVARAFSVCCAVAFVYAATAIARRIVPARAVWPFAALVAINPFTIFAALEIRVYALALLLAALGWLTFEDGFWRGADRRARLAFAALAIVSLYTQYFIAFEFVAFAVGLAIVRRWAALRAYAVVGVVVALAFAPMLPLLHGQIGGAVGVHDARAPSLARVLVHPALDFVLPLDFQARSGVAGRIVAIAIALALLVATIVGRPRFDRQLLAYAGIATTIEAIYVVLARGLHYELVAPRHYFALALPEFVVAFAIIARLYGTRARVATVTIVALLGAAAIASDVTIYGAGAKAGDWPRVGAYLTRVSKPGDTIAIDEADAIPSFERYYRGSARIVAFPRPLATDRYDLTAMIVRSRAEAEAALARLPRTGRLWFVDYGICDRSDRLGCLETHAALARRERVLQRVGFYENAVLRIEPVAVPTVP